MLIVTLSAPDDDIIGVAQFEGIGEWAVRRINRDGETNRKLNVAADFHGIATADEAGGFIVAGDFSVLISLDSGNRQYG